MDADFYQERALDTALSTALNGEGGIAYCTLGLNGEAGEVAEKIKKRMRGEAIDDEEVALELGDVLWYAAVLAWDLGYKLSEVAQMNLDKLASRKDRDALKGSGDDR